MNKNNCEDGYCYSNREKKQKPRHGYGWCQYCDRDLVGFGSKCSVCGKRNKYKRFKK